MLDIFVQTAHETAKNLKEKYSDGWNEPSPKGDSPNSMVKTDEEWIQKGNNYEMKIKWLIILIYIPENMKQYLSGTIYFTPK